uniref:Uncharacterized protein n=2 Tax=Spumella elongata TaxID=89044 RepID=A0A7S3M6C0_9STRA
MATVSVDNVLDELKLLQLQVNDRPSTTDVSNMMEGISHTFRKHLGENVVGLRGLVDQVYRQIHHKVNREDIKKLISAKLATMEQDILRREQEMFSAASSTRCMSCGQLPPDPTNAFVGHTAARKGNHHAHSHTGNNHGNKNEHTLAAVGVYSNITDSSVSSAGLNLSDKRSVQIPTMGPGFLKRPGSSPQSVLHNAPTDIHNNTEPSSSSILFNPDGHTQSGLTGPIDDDISLHSEHNGLHTNSQVSQSTYNLNIPRSEEIYNVMTGSAGLKSLMPQHAPMIPVQHPYNITNNTIHPAHTTSKRKPHTANPNAIPEPLYRKAKLASHLKEMVKVSAPSAQNYGFNAVNPFFVVEGYSEENMEGNMSVDAGGSLYSTASKGSRRPKTQGTVYNNNNNSQVYVPIPRGSTQNVNANVLLLSASTGGLTNSNSNEYTGTVLPSIK